MVQFDDDTYDDQRAVEKLFRCIPEKYKQIACSIESLLAVSTMSIEEAIGRFKVVDCDEPQPLSGLFTVGGKLHLTREQWEACHREEGGVLSLDGARGRTEGSVRGGAHSNQKPARNDACHNCGKLGHWANEC
jgi:hypothetical protein